MVECPTCGSEHSTEKNMKIHHSHEHGESIAGVVVDCFSCGTEMRVRPYRKEKYDHHTCSKDCQRELLSELKSGEHNKLLLECNNCGSDVEKWPSQVFDGVYCDRSCAIEDRAHVHEGKNQIPVQCPICGNGFTEHPSRLGRVESCCCSQECADKGHRQRMMGEHNPNYSHGQSDTLRYGPNWEDTRTKVLERDNHKCVSCGITEQQHRDRWNNSLNIHHITPLSEFDSPKEANNLENLVALCQQCHGLIEHDRIELGVVERTEANA